MTLNKILCGLALAAFAFGSTASRVDAGTLNCPGALGGGITRFVVVTWNDVVNPGAYAECEAFGSGNIGPQGFEGVPITYDSETFPWIEKDDGAANTNNGGTLNTTFGQSGAFSFSSIGNYLLGLKFGGGSGEPDWVIVQLLNIASGNYGWNPSNLGNGLSHANLWGTGTPPVNVVPEPASLLLLGTGLGLAAATLRRRRRARKTNM